MSNKDEIIFEGDVKCPYCGKEIDNKKLDEYLHNVYEEISEREGEKVDVMNNLAVICEHCEGYFEMDVRITIWKTLEICKIYS